jgi:hypothetical protein
MHPRSCETLGGHLLTVLINRKYQHDQWIGEVRDCDLGHALPPEPTSSRLALVDNYLMLAEHRP